MSNSLIYKASRFISSGHPNELIPLLYECVSSATIEALSAVKCIARDMYGGMTYNFLLKAPAAYCLLAWGESGLKSIVENVIEEPTSKNYSLAFQILAAAASADIKNGLYMWVKDAGLAKLVESTIGNPTQLKDAAKKNLNQLVMSIKDEDDVALHVGTALHGMALIDTKAVNSLFQSLSLRWIAVGLPQLEAFQTLLQKSPDDEPAFHAFLERNPLFIDPLALRIWSKPDLHGEKEPDFVVQRTDNTYIIVEIETPAKALMTRKDQISADTTHGISQVLDYSEFLMERFSEAQATFPNFSSPDGLVVIGREDLLSQSQRDALRRENAHRSRLKIVGFDSLAYRASSITRNVIEGPIIVESTRLK